MAKQSLTDEERYRLLIEAVIDYAIYMVDPDGIVTSWNPGAQRFKGYMPDEIVGQHFSCFYTEEDRVAGEPRRGLDMAARNGRFESEGWRVRKNGTRFWANVVIDPIRDEQGDLIGFAKITRDATERREAQRALDEARETLFQAQKMEAIGRLTGGVAHDFNNLLMAILGSLKLLRDGPDSAKAQLLLDNAVQAAERGAALTRRMLAFARRQDLDIEPVDLIGLTDGLGELLCRTLGPGIALETRFPDTLEPVLGDAHQLELALLNLASNARDAMPRGGTAILAAQVEEIDADHRSHLSPGHYVCLSMTDMGHGMDEHTLAQAADPFFTTKDVGKGTGLGLSMIQGMAEQTGGRLLLASRPGAGTRAEIWLPTAAPPTRPADVSAAAAIPIPAAPERAATAPPPNAGRPRSGPSGRSRRS